jgi:hypothetical protein
MPHMNSATRFRRAIFALCTLAFVVPLLATCSPVVAQPATRRSPAAVEGWS